MIKIYKIDEIKADDVVSVSLNIGAASGIPMLCVETKSNGEVWQSIESGFDWYKCNEFLRSLKLDCDEIIQFHLGGFNSYARLVSHMNTLLEIKRVMQQVSGKPYNEVDILAESVYSVILNRLLNKHHMGKLGYDKAIEKRPLEEWVAEAITYFA